MIKDTSGKVSAVLADHRHIIEHKREEEKLKESEEFSRALLEHAPNPVLVQNPDTSIRYVNPAWEKLTGYSSIEINGKIAPYPYWPEEKIGAYLEEMQRGLLLSKPSSRLRELQRKSGERFWVELSVLMVKDVEGKLRYILSNYIDITERKKAEEQILYQAMLVDNVSDAIISTNINSNILSWNKAAEKIYGWKQEEVLGKRIRDILQMEFPIGSIQELLNQLDKTGQWVGESVQKRRDGVSLNISGSVSRIQDNSGKSIGNVAIYRDVTEHKKGEEHLRQSEKKYSTLVEKGNDGVIIIQDDLLKFVNSKIIDVVGISQNEALGKPFINFVSPAYRSMVVDMYKRRMSGETVPDKYEIEILAKDGRNIPVEISSSAIEYEAKPADMAIIRDITRRKLTENKLKESEEFLSVLLDNSPNAISVINPDTSIRYINPAFEKLTGFLRSEIIGWKVPYPYWIEEEETKTAFFGSMSKREDRVERLFRHKGGKLFWASISSVTVTDGKGNPKYFLSNYLDITEPKRAQEALLQSEAKFKSLAEHSPNMIFINTGAKIAYVNQKCEEVMGYRREEFYSPEFNFLELIAPESREVVIRNFERRQWGEEDGAYEYTLIAKNGRRMESIITVSSIEYEQGRSFLGIVTDISERKRVEAEQKLSTERLVKAMEDMIQAMARIVEMRDPYTAGHQRRVAKLACEIAQEIGLPKDRIAGLRLAALIHDIGKVRVPTEILTQPDGLSEAEFAILRTHPVMGYEITKNIDLPWPIAQTIYQHHERMNGSGYPSGISGEEIILEARALAVADVVEAISSHRPYRPALGIDKALDEISEQKGKLFDINVVDACLRLFRERGFRFE